MIATNKLKIFNDPIYGFITIPNTLIYDLIQHPYFQRLRRISQMGMSYLVYPGAHHTRFHHALGCMHIMQKAIQTLQFKGVEISKEEENGLLIAILLHDIGHGPFSHAMENSIVEGVHHEEISLKFMNALNEEFGGQLDLAIQIFKGEYPRKFMYQLISSQLDMDRMDYLKRDSFYSGVAEGNINSERLIQMMNVVLRQSLCMSVIFIALYSSKNTGPGMKYWLLTVLSVLSHYITGAVFLFASLITLSRYSKLLMKDVALVFRIIFTAGNFPSVNLPYARTY